MFLLGCKLWLAGSNVV